MKHYRFLLVAAILLGGARAHAESYVAAVGDYYKERSTRVIAPSLQAHVELPDAWIVDGRLLVDQITSASGAFTATDEPFTERRYEVSGGVQRRVNDLRPSLNLRYSDETDYTSVGVAAALVQYLNHDLTSIAGNLVYTHDWVGRRTSDSSSGARQQGADEFADTLRTVMLGLTASHTLSPRLLAGATFKVQIFRGFLENVYRREQHPRARDDYALGGFLAYRDPSARFGANLDLCLHASSWGHVALAPKLEGWWAPYRWLQIVPMARLYVQPNGAFFDNGAERPDPNDPTGAPLIFNTQDPTMFAHNVLQAGLRAEFRVSGASGLLVMPAYYFRYQDTQYGNAHIAQLGLYWPFSL